MTALRRAAPMVVSAGASNVQVATGDCLIAGLLAADGAAASAVFYDATAGSLNVTLDWRAKLMASSDTTERTLEIGLQFNTGCVVSCNGAQAKLTVYLMK